MISNFRIRMYGGMKCVRKLQRLNINIKAANVRLINKLANRARIEALAEIERKGIMFTGNLLNQIQLKAGRSKYQVWLVSGAPYSRAMEFGMKPHFVHRDWFSAGGYTVGDWMTAHGIYGKWMVVGMGRAGAMPISGYRYMKRAFEKASSLVPKEARIIVSRAIKEAFGGG